METAAFLEEAPARGAPAGPQGSSLARGAPSPGTHPAAHRREALTQHWGSEPRALPAVTPAPPESTLAARFCPQPPGPPPVVRLSLCRPAPRFPMVAALQMGLSLLPGGGCGAERTRGVKQALQKVANLQPECFGGFGTRTVEVKIGLENTKTPRCANRRWTEWVYTRVYAQSSREDPGKIQTHLDHSPAPCWFLGGGTIHKAGEGRDGWSDPHRALPHPLLSLNRGKVTVSACFAPRVTRQALNHYFVSVRKVGE